MKYDLESIRKEGHKYVNLGRSEEWDAFCDKYKDSDDSELCVLAQISEIMECLFYSSGHPGSYKAITERANEEISHSASSWSYVVKNVARFSMSGVNYALHGSGMFLGAGIKEELLKLDDENKRLFSEGLKKAMQKISSRK